MAGFSSIEDYLQEEARAAGIEAPLSTAASARAKTESATMSERKSPYFHSRMSKIKQQQSETRDTLASQKETLAKFEQKVSDLSSAQETQQKTLADEEKQLEETRSELTRAQLRRQAAMNTVDNTKASINSRKEKITKFEKALQATQSKVEELETKLAREDGIAEAEAARQAELLDLKSFEIDALAKHAHGDSEFLDKLLRVSKSTATVPMQRYAKADIFEVLTRISKEEFAAMASGILERRQKMYLGPKTPVATPRPEAVSPKATGTKVAKSQALEPAQRPYREYEGVASMIADVSKNTSDTNDWANDLADMIMPPKQEMTKSSLPRTEKPAHLRPRIRSTKRTITETCDEVEIQVCRSPKVRKRTEDRQGFWSTDEDERY
ncbi:hypothetical protein H2200_003346 [Cladophialophora chaetospira]|uniref:Uncharacterized protein n=1 Tax=Cladophialophora chaetospira TaxID=386627 RepID=A0AA38XI22_9EURO|nr:hypothetical protein H2200_003346 [Cladophialophora chaetospira]